MKQTKERKEGHLMKFTKFIPVALALALAAPAFATNNYDVAPSAGPVSETMDFTIGPYFNMKEAQAPNVVYHSNDVTISSDYSNLSLDTQLKFGFDVTTNTATADYVDLTAYAKDAEMNALGGTSANPVLAFYNYTQAASVAASNVTAAIAGTGGTASKNAIAFPVNVSGVQPVANSGGTITTGDMTDGKIRYTLTNGRYQFYYTVSQTPNQTTFDTNDQEGTYKATVVLTRYVAP